MKTPLSSLKLSFLTLLFPTLCLSQVTLSVTADDNYPEGYCEIVTFTISIQHIGSASTFTGSIIYNPNDYLLVDHNGLPDFSEIIINAHTHEITFHTPIIAANGNAQFEYKMIVKAHYLDERQTHNTVIRDSDSASDYEEESTIANVYRNIEYWNLTRVTDLLEDFENNYNFTILPIEADIVNGYDGSCDIGASQSLYIPTELIIDVPEYCLKDGSIIMGSGARILVEAGSKLYIDDQTIRSCQKMWKGIYVEKGGTLIMEQCTIVNAQYGIEAERGSKIVCGNSKFIDNYVGIYVSPFAYPYDPEHPENSFVDFSLINNNDFVGSGTMLPGYEEQSPSPINKPFAGIEVNNLSSFVLYGDIGSESYNIFANMTNGIVARNTSISVGDVFFKNITRNPYDGILLDGYGIYIEKGKHSKINGNTLGVATGGLLNYHFENVETGIYSLEGGLEVYGVTMNDVDKGIYLNKVKNRKITLIQNKIWAKDKGILANHCVPRVGYIFDNYIEANEDGDKSACIEMNDNPIPLFWEIENNYLTVHEAKYGIQNVAGQNIVLMNNTIIVDPYTEDDAYGIHMNGTKDPLVTCNVITGDIEPLESNYHLSSGIYFQGANSFNITCNTISDFRYGINISSQNTGQSLLRGNIIGDQWIGLNLGSTAAIGLQFHHGNIWNGTYYETAAVHNGPNFNDVQLSLFYYDNTPPNQNFQPPSIVAVTDWFIRRQGTSFYCETENICPEGSGYYEPLVTWDSMDLELVTGNLGFPYFDNCLSWMARFNTYKRLHNVQSGSWPSAITNFLSANATLNIGKFSNAYDSLHYALKYFGTLEPILDNFPMKMDSVFERIHYLDSLLFIERNDSIEDLITELYASIYSYEIVFHEADSSIKVDLNYKLTNAISYVESISPDSSWQEELQFTLLEYLNYAKNDTLLSSNKLFELARNCPDKYGDPVFHARSLIRVDSLQNYYDEDDLCNYIYPRSTSESQLINILIKPNPANSMVEISSNEEILDLQVYDLHGRPIRFEFKVNLNTANLDVSILIPGAYIIKLRTKSGDAISKLMVIE